MRRWRQQRQAFWRHQLEFVDCDLPLKQWHHWCCWQLYSHFGGDVMSFGSVLYLRFTIYGMVWCCALLLDKQLSLTLNIAFLRIVRSMMWFWAQHCGCEWFFLLFSCEKVWACERVYSLRIRNFIFFSYSPNFSHTNKIELCWFHWQACFID